MVIESNVPRVFVIEDDAAICRLLALLLTPAGYVVKQFATAEPALEASVRARPISCSSTFTFPT